MLVSRTASRYDFITTDAAATQAHCNNRAELLYFHYFNPSGARAEWTKACDAISAAVDAGKCKSGAILAYGSMNDFAAEQLYQLVRRSTRPTASEVSLAIQSLQRATQTANDFLGRLK